MCVGLSVVRCRYQWSNCKTNRGKQCDASKVVWKSTLKYTKAGRTEGKKKSLDGWSAKGQQRFQELQRLVAENRKWEGSKEAENLALKLWQEKHDSGKERGKENESDGGEDDCWAFEELHCDNEGNPVEGDALVAV